MSVGTFGPNPALSNATAGMQIGYGGPAIPIMRTMVVPPATYTAGATVTTADLLTGLLSATLAGGAANLTLPTGALLDAAFPNAVGTTAPDGSLIGSSFDFGVNATTNTVTMVGGTGVTTNAAGAGGMTVATGLSATFRLVKTGDAAWNLYRVG